MMMFSAALGMAIATVFGDMIAKKKLNKKLNKETEIRQQITTKNPRAYSFGPDTLNPNRDCYRCGKTIDLRKGHALVFAFETWNDAEKMFHCSFNCLEQNLESVRKAYVLAEL